MEIKGGAFQNCQKIRTIGNSLRNIHTLRYSTFQDCYALEGEFDLTSCVHFETGVFYNCYKITKVVLSDELTSIAGSLFWHCYSLESVNIPSKVISIEGQAFRDCSSIHTPIILPATLISIGGAAFQGTSSIPYVKCLAVDPPTLSYSVFAESAYIIYVPDNSVAAYKSAEGWSSYASRIKPLSEFKE